MLFRTALIVYVVLAHFYYIDCNKYSKDANVAVTDLKDPFRMGKLNLIWEKARKRLNGQKLKQLLSELKIQDKEELSLKKLKSDGQDKDGFMEVKLRQDLQVILKKYGLQTNEHDDYGNSFTATEKEKYLFKDKKLHKLWAKAEKSGFTEKQLKALKEEFNHHQAKIDEYNTLFEKSNVSPNDIPNIINNIEDFEKLDTLEGSSKDFHENFNEIRDRHKEIKRGYHELHQKISSGPENEEFSDPKISALWSMAIRSNFDDFELESLYTELKHYEKRVHKLDHLTNEMNKISAGKLDSPDVDLSAELDSESEEKIRKGSDTEAKKILEQRLQKQKRKIDKIHDDIESRIAARFAEL